MFWKLQNRKGFFGHLMLHKPWSLDKNKNKDEKSHENFEGIIMIKGVRYDMLLMKLRMFVFWSFTDFVYSRRLLSLRKYWNESVIP